MIDWEEIIRAESLDELKEVKLWLFQENMRLEGERVRQEQERKDLEESRDKFINERVRFKKEMEELNRRTVMERKRLREENLFFDKKMEILQDGFRKLEEDRRTLERERIVFEAERKNASPGSAGTVGFLNEDNIAEVLFRNVNNPLALRKRYRDLVKIFHPDNLSGDEEVVQLINREFARRRREE